MRDLANAADQIKFARGAGLHAEAERHLDAVREMIRTLEDAFAPAALRRSKRRSPDGLGRLSLPGPALALGRSCSGPSCVAASLRAREGRRGHRVSRARRDCEGCPAAGARGSATCPWSWPRSAFGLGAVALARPQHGTLKEDVTTQGVDIVVALDVSGSMAAQDFQPRNRLAVAKEVVAEFVKRRPTDRIGLVVFAGKSLTKAPPTTDTAVLLRQLDDVRLEMLPDGTAIGSGLATSLTRLRRSKAKSRVVVLVTDGANNAGEIDPATAADLAKAMEVRVYTVLVGKGGQVPMPVRVRDPFTGQIVEQTVMTEVQIDEDLLQHDRGPHRRRVLPRHRLRLAPEHLRPDRQAREVGDQADAPIAATASCFRPFLLAAAVRSSPRRAPSGRAACAWPRSRP